jgi:hypothetical protein
MAAGLVGTGYVLRKASAGSGPACSITWVRCGPVGGACPRRGIWGCKPTGQDAGQPANSDLRKIHAVELGHSPPVHDPAIQCRMESPPPGRMRAAAALGGLTPCHGSAGSAVGRALTGQAGRPTTCETCALTPPFSPVARAGRLTLATLGSRDDEIVFGSHEVAKPAGVRPSRRRNVLVLPIRPKVRTDCGAGGG